MNTDKKPIPWNEVAYVAFDGDRPCLICSAEPDVLFGVFAEFGDSE